jgi:predicted ATP-dependent serine protease
MEKNDDNSKVHTEEQFKAQKAGVISHNAAIINKGTHEYVEKHGRAILEQASKNTGIPLLDNEQSKAELNLVEHEDFTKKEIAKPNWIIQDMIPENGMTVLYGETGHGKSLVTTQISLCCKYGADFIGEKVKPCNVLYIDEENGEIVNYSRALSFEKRIKKPTEKKLYWSHFSNFKIDDDSWISNLSEVIEKNDINLVVLDSLLGVVSGDSNSAKDMRVIFDNIKKLLHTRKQLCFLVIHHTNKAGSFLGSIDIKNQASTFYQLEQQRDNDGKKHIILECQKNRLGENSSKKIICHIEGTLESKEGQIFVETKDFVCPIKQDIIMALASGPKAFGVLVKVDGKEDKKRRTALAELVEIGKIMKEAGKGKNGKYKLI